MKSAYLGISLSNRPHLDPVIEAIRKVLQNHNIELWVFVDQYRFAADEEQKMMQQAFHDIDKTDFFIAEMSKKAVGVGIELGYAFAKKKPIIYLKEKDTPYSTTTRGCATYFIDYQGIEQLSIQLHKTIETLLQ